MDGRWRQLTRVLRHPNLRRLLSAFGLFAIAEHATWLAVTVFAYGRGGVGEAGVVFVVLLVPAVVVAPFAAYAGDRFRKDVVLTVGYVCQAVSMLATAAAMWRDAPSVVVYGAATTASVALTFTRPGMGALLPAAISTPADLVTANVGCGVLERLGQVVGPALAGLLLQLGNGPAWVFAVMGAALTVAAVAVSRLHLDRDLAAPEVGVEAGDVVRDALGGFRTLRRHVDLRLLVTALAMSSVLVGAGDVLIVAVGDGLLDSSTSRAGLLGMAIGLGALCGALGSVALVGRARLAIPLATAVATTGGAVALMSAMSHLAPVFVLFMLAGAGTSVARISGFSLIQRFAPAAVLSRVFGVMEGLHMAGLAVGGSVVSLLVNWFGLRTGLLLIGLTIPALIAMRAPRLVRIDADAPAPRPTLVDLVLGYPIFAHLPPITLERLLANVEAHAFEPGAVVIREGEEGDRFYLVEQGELAVTADGRAIRMLGPGSGFGEIALIRDVPRTATVTTTTSVVLHAVRRADFLAALSGRPGGWRAAREHAQRVLDDDPGRLPPLANDE